MGGELGEEGLKKGGGSQIFVSNEEHQAEEKKMWSKFCRKIEEVRRREKWEMKEEKVDANLRKKTQ